MTVIRKLGPRICYRSMHPADVSSGGGGIKTKRIRNSRGEPFNVVWAKALQNHPSIMKDIIDPRTWQIDTQEREAARAFSAISPQDLEITYFDLIREPYPAMGSAQELSSLAAFIDNLSGPMEMIHFFKEPIATIQMISSATKTAKDKGTLTAKRKARYEQMLINAYKYKAFIRELVIRWSIA